MQERKVGFKKINAIFVLLNVFLILLFCLIKALKSGKIMLNRKTKFETLQVEGEISKI